MPTFSDTTFEHEARRLLEETLDRLTQAATDGVPQNFAAYRELVGEIKGCRDALDACKQARRLISGEEPHTDALTRRKMAFGPKEGVV